jgi:hypothetical protein
MSLKKIHPFISSKTWRYWSEAIRGDQRRSASLSTLIVKVKRATVWHEYPYPPVLQHFIEVPRPLFGGEGQAAQLLPAIFDRLLVYLWVV